MSDSVITTLLPLVTVAAHEGVAQTAAPAPEEPRKSKGAVLARRVVPSAMVSAMSTVLGTIAAGTIAATSPSTGLSGFTGFAGGVQCFGGIVEIIGGGIKFGNKQDGAPWLLRGFGDLLMGLGLIVAADGLGYPALIPILGGVAINLTGALSTPKTPQ